MLKKLLQIVIALPLIFLIFFVELNYLFFVHGHDLSERISDFSSRCFILAVANLLIMILNSRIWNRVGSLLRPVIGMSDEMCFTLMIAFGLLGISTKIMSHHPAANLEAWLVLTLVCMTCIMLSIRFGLDNYASKHPEKICDLIE